MSKLNLAMEIADAAAEAESRGTAVDLDQKSGELQAAHPDAKASQDEIADALKATVGKTTPPKKAKP